MKTACRHDDTYLLGNSSNWRLVILTSNLHCYSAPTHHSIHRYQITLKLWMYDVNETWSINTIKKSCFFSDHTIQQLIFMDKIFENCVDVYSIKKIFDCKTVWSTDLIVYNLHILKSPSYFLFKVNFWLLKLSVIHHSSIVRNISPQTVCYCKQSD